MIGGNVWVLLMKRENRAKEIVRVVSGVDASCRVVVV